jgi:hypothetical protein
METMSDEELAALLRYAEAMQSTSLPDDYDEANDPSIGFLSGTTDLATHTKEILRREFTTLSGWTQKKD